MTLLGWGHVQQSEYLLTIQLAFKELSSGQGMPNYEERWLDDQASYARLVDTKPTYKRRASTPPL